MYSSTRLWKVELISIFEMDNFWTIVLEKFSLCFSLGFETMDIMETVYFIKFKQLIGSCFLFIFVIAIKSLMTGIQAFVCSCNRSTLDSDGWRRYRFTCLCSSWSYHSGNWTLCWDELLWGHPLQSSRTCDCKLVLFSCKQSLFYYF